MAKKENMTKKKAEELAKLVADTRRTLREVRFAAAGSRPADPSAPRKLRKVVARVLTEQNRRSRTSAPAA
jgi:ribosomal protein L29